MAEAGTINETEQVQQQEQDPQQQIVVEDEDDRKLFVGGLPQDATQVLNKASLNCVNAVNISLNVAETEM